MKRFFIVLTLAVLFASPAFAIFNPVATELNQTRATAESMIAEGEGLAKAETALLQEKAAIEPAMANIKAEIAVFNRQVSDWDVQIESRNRIIDDYNRRCAKTFPYEQKAAYDACRSEEPRMSQYDRESAEIINLRERTRAPIKARAEAVDARVDNFNTKWNRHSAKAVDFEKRKVAIIAKLNALAKKYDECDAAIATGSNETMSAVCGQTWDGSRWLPSGSNFRPAPGGMTITPNK